jgi:hypothetical protein
MNKAGFVFSWILSIIGIITLIKTTIINLAMPKLGQLAFQIAMKGSYSPNEYYINFKGVNIIAVLLIIAGLLLGYVFYKRENKTF